MLITLSRVAGPKDEGDMRSPHPECLGQRSQHRLRRLAIDRLRGDCHDQGISMPPADSRPCGVGFAVAAALDALLARFTPVPRRVPR